VGCARKLLKSGRISPDETTVLSITGNGLKTTDALADKYEVEEPIAPRFAEFEAYLQKTLNVPEVVEA
jgi:threonine synthase